MLFFGEKLNSSIPKTLEIYKTRDEKAITELIKAQKHADYLDINTSLCEHEEEMLEYVIELAEANSDAKIMPDSADPEVLKKAAKYIKGDFILNSVTCDERINELMPIVCETGCGVICLPIDRNGVPDTPEKRLANAEKIIKTFEENGVSRERLYMDVLVEPVAVDPEAVKKATETCRLYKKELCVRTTCGLSNVSFGLPKRSVINSYFLSLLIYNGLDSAIANVMDKNIIAAARVSEMLAGDDEYCMNYIEYMTENL